MTDDEFGPFSRFTAEANLRRLLRGHSLTDAEILGLSLNDAGHLYPGYRRLGQIIANYPRSSKP